MSLLSHRNDDKISQPIHLNFDGGKRFAHMAMKSYKLTMATLQPDDKKPPNCACSQMNKRNVDDDKVIVIVEHDLKEHILCILDRKKLHQCKLDLMIQSGEQIAFRTIGKIPVQLSGSTLR